MRGGREERRAGAKRQLVLCSNTSLPRFAPRHCSFGKTFFAFGTLLSFIKTFRYIGISRRLALFTETVQKAFGDVALLMIVFLIIIAGFSVGFHIAFGQGVRDFMDFPTAALSLILLSLGDFDADQLRTGEMEGWSEATPSALF